MRFSNRSVSFGILALGAALVAPAGTARAQGGAGGADATHPPAAVASLLRDIATVEEKIISLAEAIPEDRYDWRPGPGVRSVLEVMMHIATDNYFLPTVAGVDAPAATAIKAGDYSSAQAYERRSVTKAEAIQALRDSFAHLRAAMEATDQTSLDRTLNVFGSEMTGFDLWVITTTHLHEHLGQSIAYARTNDVVPPWSRGG